MTISLESLTAFFGWMSIINVGVLLFSTLMICFLSQVVTKLHTQLFGLDSIDVKITYFQILGKYKIMILVFNVVPYFAFKLIS